jgi:hypothetical protein
VNRVKTSSRRPAILRHVSRISLNPPSKFLDNTSNKDHEHFHILPNSLNTYCLVLRCYRPIVSLLMASLMRCYNPSVWYSVIKPLNNSSFGHTYSQISWNVIIEHMIIKPSNITCPFYRIFEKNSIMKLHTCNSTSILFTHSMLLTLHKTESAWVLNCSCKTIQK